MSSYYYMEKNTKKYLETGRIWDDRAELEYTDEGAVYEFKFEKNKLKLYLTYWNDWYKKIRALYPYFLLNILMSFFFSFSVFSPNLSLNRILNFSEKSITCS